MIDRTIQIPRHGGHNVDGLNGYRADQGQAVIDLIILTSDDDSCLADTLANLMHWASANGRDFANELQNGVDHFAVETSKEGPG